MSLRLELEDLEQAFREAAMKKYGYSKGALQKASREALQKWVHEQQSIQTVKDPFHLMRGILKRYRGKITSVALQHEAKELWVKR